ncbi:type II toxin-antitoxin system TacA family antitoxin [Planktothrix paucivesiculata]|uniref:DUF1778 domain-containing protein n=1 Tax=Planktothrix paucivesiculata PCC 9631 TaxID=671071 RepID=A0A7Z9C049_9CYAN|nr:DUF1778 domain-containing protein [Planktothrix paucivesiculata]VXD25334.1 conserved hypothetical protein [Planktothrix paucivesiculata PCC 9631]
MTVMDQKCVDNVYTKLLIWNQATNQQFSLALTEVSFMCGSESQELVSQTREVTINIRAKQNQRDFIDQAAKIQGKSRSEFMLQTAYEKAQDVILGHCFFGLDEDKFQKFVVLLDTPPMQNEKLQALLNTKSPWD